MISATICCFYSCKDDSLVNRSNSIMDSLNKSQVVGEVKIPSELKRKRQKIKLGHTVNTVAHEYLPVFNKAQSILFFSAMDRTGYFDFKLDFTKEKSSGGEDIFFSKKEQGLWSDARPLSSMNTNAHEVVTQVLGNGDLLVSSNYPEKFGPKMSDDQSQQTTDIFQLKKTDTSYRILHLSEPVNSIYSEADAWMTEDGSCILFVSDRPCNQGEYKKKGWKWNDSYWGNTDIYVSLKQGDTWSVPVNLGSKINTAGAERTPFLSEDGFTLFLSSNGYKKGRNDLDVYAFKRNSLQDWTEWEGPFPMEDANTKMDDWGYKETSAGEAYYASQVPLGFTPTQKGMAGDGGIRETNYRSGYMVFGQQVASLNRERNTEIFYLKNVNEPVFILEDVFFEYNKSTFNKKFETLLLKMVDYILQNPEFYIEIHGYTDALGEADNNLKLSKERAERVKLFFESKGVKNKIKVIGHGEEEAKESRNRKAKASTQRRVEINFSN